MEEFDPRRRALDDGGVHGVEAITAPMGTAALVRPLAQVIMSGTTPKRSAAVAAPSRPKAVITSSKMRRMPWRRLIWRRRSR